MSQVWDAQLPTAEKMILLVIADHADDDGRNAWPSIATIARKASMSDRQAQRYVKSLCDRGLVRCEAQAGGTRDMRDDRRPNRYTINVRALVNGVTPVTSREPNGVTLRASRGDTQGQNGVTPMSPKPSGEPSTEPPYLFPDAPRQVAAVAAPVCSAREITAHWVDTYRAVHGEDPAGQSVKRVAQAAKQLLDEGRVPDVVLAAAADAATGGHANLASAVTYLLAKNKSHGRVTEPRGFAGIREFMEGA
jgi:hypothetical protein